MSASIDGSAIDKVLRDAVDSGGVPHVAAIAADRDGVIYSGAAGPRAVGESDPVTVDTLFRIMSMTKMPCTVAALQQVEQGNLDLDAPVADYCPEFAEKQVLEGFDGDTPRLRPPARQATVKNLVTHTSGLGYWFWSDNLVKWESVTGIPNVVAGSASSLQAPLLADPGTAFIYGINTDWLGKVVEAVTGKGLDVAIKEGITGPLGMDQTTFLMNDEQRPNSTPVHVKGEDGNWVSARGDPEPGAGVLGRRARALRAAERLHQVRAGATARRRARRDPDPEVRDGRRGLHQPDRRPGLPRRHRNQRPGRDLRVQRGSGLQVGSGTAAQHRGHPGHAAGRVRGLGRAVQHALLGRPHDRRHRVDLQQLPAVRHARGDDDVQRLRAGAVRLAMIA